MYRDSEAGKNVEEGWGSSAYAVSKVGVSALTFVQQRLFDAETPNRNIAVNAVHPGKFSHLFISLMICLLFFSQDTLILTWRVTEEC